MARGLLDRFFLHGTVAEVAPVARRMRRIRITGPELRDLTWLPGQQIRVDVGAGIKPTLRTYSLWDADGDALELCVYEHGQGGPGERWSQQVVPGAEVRFTRPDGKLVLRDAAYHVFVGEETAAAAFGPMLRALPASTAAYGVIEVDEPEDRLPMPDSVTWTYRHGTSAAASVTLIAALAELTLPAEPGAAYLAGEARAVQAARRDLVHDRGWPRRAVATKPFWSPGRTGMD